MGLTAQKAPYWLRGLLNVRNVTKVPDRYSFCVPFAFANLAVVQVRGHNVLYVQGPLT